MNPHHTHFSALHPNEHAIMILPVRSEDIRPVLQVTKRVQTLDRFLSCLEGLPDVLVQCATHKKGSTSSQELSAFDCIVGDYSSSSNRDGTVTISHQQGSEGLIVITNPPYNKTMLVKDFMVIHTTPWAAYKNIYKRTWEGNRCIRAAELNA